MMKKLILVICSLLIVQSFSVSGWIVPGAHAQTFTGANFQGAYGFALNGLVTIPGPNSTAVPGPMSVVGQIQADGQGVGTVTREVNLLGFQVINQSGNMTFTINGDGTGNANVSYTNSSNIGALPGGVTPFPDTTSERYSIVLNREGDEIQILGTNLRNAKEITSPTGAE